MHTNCCQPLCGGQTQTWLKLLRVGRGRREPAILSPSTPAVIYLLPLTGAQGGGGGQYRVSYPHPPPGKKRKKNKQNPATLLPNPGGLLYFQPPG